MNYYIFSNYEEKIFLKIKAWFLDIQNPQQEF